MKRRDFLELSGKSILLTGLMEGLNLKAFAGDDWADASFKSVNNDHVLVLIQLNGGNDGLNMVLPLDQYSALSTLRSNVLIPDTQALKIGANNTVGLHPAMTGLKRLYDENKLLVVRDVGYPNPNFSHFRATDIWTSGSDANQVVSSGWLGRYLNTEYPNFPLGFPNSTNPDPLALFIGAAQSPVFQGPTINMSYSVTDPTNFYNLISNNIGTTPNTPAGHELSFLRQMKNQYDLYSGVVKNAANNVTSQFSGYPTAGTNSLADQLKIVARLIKGGLKTKIYMVSIGGFDTHSAQVTASDHSTGIHAALLSGLSAAITAFTDDLYFLGIQDRVIGMTFSEFGRRIVSNGSDGTDHGAAAPLFMFGSNVQSGILGNNPTLNSSMTSSDNLPFQYDFRSIYASILKDWFCVDQATQDAIMLQQFQTLPLIKPGNCAPLSIRDANLTSGKHLINVYPNPCTDKTTLTFEANQEDILIQVFDPTGKVIYTIEHQYGNGSHTVSLNTSQLASGLYYVRFQAGMLQQVKPFVKVVDR